MLTHEQGIAYLEETLPPKQAADVQAELAADPAAAAQLTQLAQYDSALRTLLGGGVELARIEQSVLAAICGGARPESEASVSRPTPGQMPDPRSSNLGRHEGNNMNNPSTSPNGENDYYNGPSH